MANYYKTNEYPILVGNEQSSSALCVVWQNLDNVIRYYPWIKDKFAIVGNLRSAFGVNIILYNLARNPNICNFYLWGPDRLSNTDIGVEGRNTLSAFWKNGTTKEGDIVNGNFKLIKEVETGICDEIRKNVQLEDISSTQILLPNDFPFKKEAEYMPAYIFPEFKIKAPETMPSEDYHYVARAKKGAAGYLSLLYNIWKYGKKTSIDPTSEEVKEIKDAVVVVEEENPDSILTPDWLADKNGLNVNLSSLENYYRSQFCKETYNKEIFPRVFKFERPANYSYLYSELIFAYPRPKIIDEAVEKLVKNKQYTDSIKFITDNSTLTSIETKKLLQKVTKSKLAKKEQINILLEGLIPPVDQVAYVIDRIKRKTDDLDKEIMLWDVWRNTLLESGRPCINKLSFIVRNEKIDLHVYVRSHDVGKAWFYNYYGIVKLLGKIAKETDNKIGTIVIESHSAHIYRRDWDMIRKLIEEKFEKKNPVMFFDPKVDTDPRGIINVGIDGKKILVKLQDIKTGNILFELKGRTARELLYKIKHFQLISKIDHGIFIGGELAKAEICIKLGIPYKYDNPIALPNGQSIIS